MDGRKKRAVYVVRKGNCLSLSLSLSFVLVPEMEKEGSWQTLCFHGVYLCVLFLFLI